MQPISSDLAIPPHPLEHNIPIVMDHRRAWIELREASIQISAFDDTLDAIHANMSMTRMLISIKSQRYSTTEYPLVVQHYAMTNGSAKFYHQPVLTRTFLETANSTFPDLLRILPDVPTYHRQIYSVMVS